MNDKRKYEIEVTIGTIKLRVPIHKKKQEFNGSYLVLNNVKCPPKSKKYIQNGSQVLKKL